MYHITAIVIIVYPQLLGHCRAPVLLSMYHCRYDVQRRRVGNKAANEKQKLRYKVKRERKVRMSISQIAVYYEQGCFFTVHMQSGKE